MAAAIRKGPKPEPSIAEVAKRALDDAKGDIDAAAAMFEQAIRASQRLRDLLTEPLIAQACRDAVKNQMRQERRAVWLVPAKTPSAPPRADAQVQANRVVQLAAGTLLMFPLPGGKYLGDANREEITAAAAMYATRATDAGHKARWLQLIAQSVPKGKAVKDVLSDQRLRELQAEAEHG